MPSNPFKNEPSSTRLALNRIGLRVRNLERRFINPGTTNGVIAEELFLDSKSGTAGATTVLEDGGQYLITVRGTFIYYDLALDLGTPEPDAMFPSSGTRISTEVGCDADTVFAKATGTAGPKIGHSDIFRMDLDGSGAVHVEPDDGPHAVPTLGHFYQYTVIGQGVAPTFSINDTVFGDNYGKLLITIQTIGGSSDASGDPGGGGSLVPPPGDDHSILRVANSIPKWEAQPDITEDDLDLSDVTTANSSTGQHGLLPKLTGDSTDFLDGTGAFRTLGGGGTSPNNDTVYVAPPTGVAATDNAAIAAAITACPTGGCVQLQAGTYAIIDGTTTSSIAIAKQITLRGRGGADASWATFGTLLTVDHATAVGISISANGVQIEQLAIQNIHSTAPTAGAGIQTVTGGGIGTHYGPYLSVRGFFYCVDHQAGYEWTMAPSCFMYDFASVGLRIQNVDLIDGGDMTVSGNFIAGPVNNAHAAIQWLSGGGFKGYGIKTNTRGSATLFIGIDLELQDGNATGDFSLVDSSIENSTWGILLEHAGPSNTGTFDNIVICGCQFATVGTLNTQSVIAIAPAATGKVSEVFVGGNVIKGGGSSQKGLNFTKLDNATHGPNVYKSNAGFFDGGSNTNIKNLDSVTGSPLTTKGDIWVFGSADARLAVGADGKLLVADSGQTDGLGYSTVDLDVATHKIKNVVDPVSAQDAATKNYVDTHGGGSGTVDGISTVTLVAGTNITITDNSPSAGDITIASSGGGGGLAKSQIGYATIGGSSVTATQHQVIAKQITPGSSGLLTAIAIYLQWQADMVAYINVGVWDDNSSAIGKLLAGNTLGTRTTVTSNSAGAGGADAHQTSEVARWITIPLACELAASTNYWIGFQLSTDSGVLGTLPLIFFDTSGTDRRYTPTPFALLDGQSASQGTDSRKHSLYGIYLS